MRSIWGWFTAYAQKHADALLNIGKHLLEIILLYIAAKIVIRISIRVVNRLLSSRTVRLDERRRATMISVFDNMIRYTIYFIWTLMVLPMLDLHIETLLAGAGIAGLAVGFGAQNLIKDVLTGFFILFEDQYAVGDSVKINQFSGTVKTIGLRLTRIQAWTGEIEIIPNGQIQQVTNYSKSNSLAVLDVGVSYNADLQQAIAVIQDTMNHLKQDNPNIVGDIQTLGVQTLGKSEVVIRATAECLPTTNAGVQREAYKRIKEALEKEGIEMPYSTQAGWLQATEPTNAHSS